MYMARDEPFPVGSILLKEEYARDDCTDLDGYTVMRREPPGYDPESGDWHWQRLDTNRRVTEDGLVERCRSCHADCGEPPDGWDGTCAAFP